MDNCSVLVVVGVVLLMLALAGKLVSAWLAVDFGRQPLQRLVIGLLGAIILAFGLMCLWPRANPQSEPGTGSGAAPESPGATAKKAHVGIPAVTIGQPGDNQVVPRPPVVTGTIRNAAPGTHVWLVVNPSGELGWWPQGGPLVPRIDGTFEQPVFLGGRPGQRFRIVAVQAPETAHLAFTRYLQDGAAHNRYPATPLPAGASVLTAVEVVLDPATPP